MKFFWENKVDNLVIVNPDNPSGNYIPKADVLRLIEWSKNQEIKLVIDESFVDFADEEDWYRKSLRRSYGNIQP